MGELDFWIEVSLLPSGVLDIDAFGADELSTSISTSLLDVVVVAPVPFWGEEENRSGTVVAAVLALDESDFWRGLLKLGRMAAMATRILPGALMLSPL